jgi:putative ABC transport system permease protein
VQSARGCRVSANFFDVLGVSPALGRAFSLAEEQPGADQVAVVSYGFWQRQFAGDAGLLGKMIQMNGKKYTVVGMMPRGFDYPVPMELWVPLALSPAEKADRTKLSLESLARLKPGIDVAQARSAADSVAKRLQQEYPATNANRRTEVLQLRRELYLYTLPLFLLLQAAAVFVLLLACANLANLLFARIFGRQKEIAVRTALGAGRWRLARLFVTETLLLSCIAGGVAIAVSFWSVRILRTSIASSWTMWVPGWDGIQVDRTVLAFTVLLIAAVGLLFGLGTVLHANQTEPYNTLKEAGRGPMLGSKGRLRSALVVAQVMFALVLLVCAGLTTQAFLRLVDVYQGFAAANVLRTEIRLPKKAYSENSQIDKFYDRVLRGSGSLAGANAAAVVTNSPASNVDNETTFFTIKGRPTVKANESPAADLQISSPDYFSVLRIPLVAGRVYSYADTSNAGRVAVISRSMAARYWPNGDELGQQIRLGAADSTEPVDDHRGHC